MLETGLGEASPRQTGEAYIRTVAGPVNTSLSLSELRTESRDIALSSARCMYSPEAGLSTPLFVLRSVQIRRSDVSLSTDQRYMITPVRCCKTPNLLFGFFPTGDAVGAAIGGSGIYLRFPPMSTACHTLRDELFAMQHRPLVPHLDPTLIPFPSFWTGRMPSGGLPMSRRRHIRTALASGSSGRSSAGRCRSSGTRRCSRDGRAAASGSRPGR